MQSQSNTVPVRPGAIIFWRLYAIHMRPYLLFVSGATGIAGLAYSADFTLLPGILLVGSFFLSYGFAQALTDCFQTDTDSISSPYRPLVRGSIRRDDVIWVSLAGLAACAVVLTMANPLTLPFSTAAVLGLLTYTYFKRRWWAGPFYNAWIVAAVYLLGVLDGAPHDGLGVLADPVVLITVVAVFFGYANFVLSGYFKDISADRKTGYDTFPVRFGMRTAAVVSDIFALIALVAAAITVWRVLSVDPLSPGAIAALASLAAGAAASVVAQARLHRVQSEDEAHRAINPVVHAYVLLLTAVVISLQPTWTLLMAAFYAGFWMTMRHRPQTGQI